MNNRNASNLLIACFLYVWVILVALICCGCSVKGRASNVPDSLPAIGSGIEKTGAHIESAERLNASAKPSAGSAKPLLDQVTAEHQASLVALSDVRHDLASATSERDRLTTDNTTLAEKLTRVTNGWGYRLQLWVTRLLTLLIALSIFHFVGGAAALFIPGPIGAGIATAAAVVNPCSWFQTARDNYFFRVKGKQ